MYNYLKNTDYEDGDGDEEERLGLIKQPKTCPKVMRNRSDPKSPISPYDAHQKLKRTKTQRRAQSKKRNYEKKIETHSNLTLYNS